MPHYENVPFNVPDNWIWTTVEEILELVSGQDFPPEKYNNNVSGVPYIIGASNIENEQLVINRWTEFPSVFSYINDLLVVCKGAGVGKMAINNIGTAHIARQIQAVRAYTNYINIKYIKAVVKHNIEDIISKANGLIPGLKRELLLSLQIPLPPFSEQQRIIIEMEHLFTLIDKVEENKYDLQAIIKQAKNKILDLAIQGKLVQQDLNEEPASELLKRINPKAEITCDNGHYTQLPEGWQIVSMQTLCNLIDGEKQSGIERINLDVKYLRGERDAKKLMAGKYIPANSLLILVDGENSGEVFRTPIDGYQGSTFKQLSITDEMNADYVLQVISLHRKTLRENKVGSAIPHLNKKLFKAIEVPIPPYNQQKKIVEAINIMFKHLDAIMESL
uniref:restriction endonuclease subunit S n=1 Tax=Phocaeicola plebeius TaxID=310297 RepID=UPI00359C1199